MRVSHSLACSIVSIFILVCGCGGDTEPEAKPDAGKTASKQKAPAEKFLDTQSKPVAKDRWDALEPAIFECAVKGGLTTFSSTVTYLTGGYLHDKKWHYHSKAATSNDFAAKSEANVLIEGNCTSKITLPDGGMIHIKGDLTGELDVKGHCEIIIAGEVSKGALIKTDGIVDILVGGDVNGNLVNISSSVYFIKGNLNGNVVTGDPSIYLYVYGDCYASFAHYGDRGSMMRLMVEGYMPLDNMEQLQKLKYTEVLAFVQESNSPRRTRPTYGHRDQTWYVKHLRPEKSP